MEIQEKEEKYIPGSMVIFKNLTNEQRDIFLKLISDEYSYLFQVLFNILDDNILTLELIDIFAGQRIQFPTRKRMYKLLEKIQIYTFVKNRNYSSESYRLLAKQYKKRVSQITATVERVDYLLNNGKFKNVEHKEKDIES